jgi:hypothetical protein
MCRYNLSQVIEFCSIAAAVIGLYIGSILNRLGTKQIWSILKAWFVSSAMLRGSDELATLPSPSN